MWYALIGAVITIVIGTVVSIITCPQDVGQLDSNLVFPFLRRWVGRSRLVFLIYISLVYLILKANIIQSILSGM